MSISREIAITGDAVTPDLFSELEANRHLEQLTIWSGTLNNEQLEPVSRLTQLKGLCLGELKIDDGVFRYLQPLRRLEYLNLAYTGVRGDFRILKDLPLRDVRLEGCRLVGDQTTAYLATFPTLRQLEIHMTGLTDAGVELLAALPLEVLWLGPRITDRGLTAVGKIATLRHLDLCAHMVTDEGIPALAALGNLEVLWLSRCSLTDHSVPVISRFASLRELNVSYTGISETGIAALRAALPACRFIEPD